MRNWSDPLGISTAKSAWRRDGNPIDPGQTSHELSAKRAKTGLDGSGVVVDVKNLAGISQKGEDVLLELLNEGAKFRCRGVFAKQTLRQLASGRRRNVKETTR